MEFHTEYYDATCYTGRTDFTKFAGWSCIRKTDQRQLGFGPPLDKDATPIRSLTLEQHGNCSSWKIVARVTAKSDIRTFSNYRGDGKLFSVELLDASGMDIRATLFNQAVDKFHDKIKVGQVYEIADAATLKAANAQYNTCQSSLEMTLNEHSHIEAASAVHNTRFAVPFELVPLARIFEQESQPSETNNHKKVDVLAVVATVSDVESITKENGSKLEKREIVLVDQSSTSQASSTCISWTLWGKAATATSHALKAGTVVAIRHSHVREFLGQPTLSGAAHWEQVDLITNAHQQQLNGTSMLPDHVRAQAQQLQQWWDTNEANLVVATHAAVAKDNENLENTKSMETQNDVMPPTAVEEAQAPTAVVKIKQVEASAKEKAGGAVEEMAPAGAPVEDENKQATTDNKPKEEEEEEASSGESKPQGDDDAEAAKPAPTEKQKKEIKEHEQYNDSTTIKIENNDKDESSKMQETTTAAEEVAPPPPAVSSESNPIVQEESSSSEPPVGPTETKPNASSSNETTSIVAKDKTLSPSKRKLEEQAPQPEQPAEKQMKTTTTPQETSNKENAAQVAA